MDYAIRDFRTKEVADIDQVQIIIKYLKGMPLVDKCLTMQDKYGGSLLLTRLVQEVIYYYDGSVYHDKLLLGDKSEVLRVHNKLLDYLSLVEKYVPSENNELPIAVHEWLEISNTHTTSDTEYYLQHIDTLVSTAGAGSKNLAHSLFLSTMYTLYDVVVD